MHEHRFLAVIPLFLAIACNSNSDKGSGGTGEAPDLGVVAMPDLAANTPPDLVASAPPDLAPSGPPPTYTVPLFDNVRLSGPAASDPSAKNNQIATFTLHDGPYAQVKLVADLATTCYPFDKWKTNPPPPGQNFPADCDAYDRRFEFTLDPPANGGTTPAIDLVRAVTPFGGPMHVEADVTDVANGLPGQHTLNVYIDTWRDASGQGTGSAGGWNLTAHLEVWTGSAPHKVLAVIPLVDRYNNGGDAPTVAQLTVPAGTTSTRLEYRATGHGQGNDQSASCIGPAEEFCMRSHHVLVDNKEIELFTPWRTDCDQNCTLGSINGQSYCLQNPTGQIDSVKAPRANWCPSTVTPPRTWDPAALHTPGAHTFTYAIDNPYTGGMNAGWRVSAVLFAFGN
jgi:hypothetical protein